MAKCKALTGSAVKGLMPNGARLKILKEVNLQEIFFVGLVLWQCWFNARKAF